MEKGRTAVPGRDVCSPDLARRTWPSVAAGSLCSIGLRVGLLAAPSWAPAPPRAPHTTDGSTRRVGLQHRRGLPAPPRAPRTAEGLSHRHNFSAPPGAPHAARSARGREGEGGRVTGEGGRCSRERRRAPLAVARVREGGRRSSDYLRRMPPNPKLLYIYEDSYWASPGLLGPAFFRRRAL